MFNYKEFKKEMQARGHEVHKNGDYITIIPNNNYIEYAKGFNCGTDIIEGFDEDLKFVNMEHFNTWIYSATFKIKEKVLGKHENFSHLVKYNIDEVNGDLIYKGTNNHSGSLKYLKPALIYNLQNGIISEISRNMLSSKIVLTPEAVLKNEEDIYNCFFRNHDGNSDVKLTDYLTRMLITICEPCAGDGYRNVLIKGKVCRFVNCLDEGGLQVSDKKIAEIDGIITSLRQKAYNKNEKILPERQER